MEIMGTDIIFSLSRNILAEICTVSEGKAFWPEMNFTSTDLNATLQDKQVRGRIV